MPALQNSDLVSRLRTAVRGDVDASAGTRAMYGADASNYRRIPTAVVRPASAADVRAVLEAAADAGVAVTPRGGGTSVAGNAIGEGVVLDTSRHLTRILDIDPDRRLARVEPGVTLAALQAAARPYGLRFGPDPSTGSRCTIGGMIGNNACGSHSVAWGTTADNVQALDLLTAEGAEFTVSAGDDAWQAGLAAGGEQGRIFAGLHQLEEEHRGTWRRELSGFPRRVSGYGVDHLLPERQRSVARALVGTEGTCGVVVGATVQLVEVPPAQVLVVLGYPDDVVAADAVPALLPYGPLTVEGMDRELVRLAGRSGSELPDGQAWLFVEIGGATQAEATEQAHDLVRAVGASAPDGPSWAVIADAAVRADLWRIRKAGAGLATRDARGGEAWPGWEDAAVPPEHLGAYLRDFRGLLRQYGLRGVSYGHFGEGCLHVRIDFDLLTDRGAALFRSFVEEAADAVVRHGGSLSGEHGDGAARSSLLPRMYSPAVMRSFEEFKRVWDPHDRLNPGVIVRPAPVDSDLRYRGERAVDVPTPALSYPDDGGDLARALRRCVGVGACRADDSPVMCPSWHVTGEERHTTRGRARLLQEIVSGSAVTDGWRSEDARDALDLCLSCKGCSSDCPVGVDMATYKAEFLHQHYKGRLRPRAHYSLGWLPLVARAAMRMPRVVNALGRSRLAGLVNLVGGIEQGRRLPPFPRRSFLASSSIPTYRNADFGPPGAGRPVTGQPGAEQSAMGELATAQSGVGPPGAGERAMDRPGVGERVALLWPDTFNTYLTPDVLHAGVRVLESAGLELRRPDGAVCCGLTWFSTGQLSMARRVLRRTGRALRAGMDADVPIVVLEPSCAVMLRTEARSVLGDTPVTRYLRRRVVTLAEALEELAPGWQPPQVGGQAVGQVHCHQTSVLGFDADRRVMERAGMDAGGMQASCCGLAGNFGFEPGHLEISTAIAERLLLPALRAAPDEARVLADGFSCRTQIEQLDGRRALHLAEVLAEGLP